jgi:hypothetical protein
MQYLAQSDGWKFDRVMKPKTTLGQDGQSRMLGKFRQIFPLALFRDDVIVEELRVVWVRRKGPWVSEIISIMATDIACVNASKGLITGEVHIQSVTGGPEIFVDKIKGSHAYEVRDLVEGIALASREGLRIEKTKDLNEERAELLRAGQVRTSLI